VAGLKIGSRDKLFAAQKWQLAARFYILVARMRAQKRNVLPLKPATCLLLTLLANPAPFSEVHAEPSLKCAKYIKEKKDNEKGRMEEQCDIALKNKLTHL